MSADSFHHQIEEELRRRKFVEDFDDFQAVIDKKGTSLVMDFKDFKQYESKLSKSSKSHYPKLATVKVVQFRKGSFKIFWKTDPIDVEYKEGIFLQPKFIKARKSNKKIFAARSEDRGIQKQKKNDIIKKLCPLMKNRNRIYFWKNIPASDSSDLLLDNEIDLV